MCLYGFSNVMWFVCLFVSIISWICIQTDGEITEVEVNCRGLLTMYCSSDVCTTEREKKKRKIMKNHFHRNCYSFEVSC